MDRRDLMKMGAGAMVTGFVSSASATPASAGIEKPMSGEL